MPKAHNLTADKDTSKQDFYNFLKKNGLDDSVLGGCKFGSNADKAEAIQCIEKALSKGSKAKAPAKQKVVDIGDYDLPAAMGKMALGKPKAHNLTADKGTLKEDFYDFLEKNGLDDSVLADCKFGSNADKAEAIQCIEKALSKGGKAKAPAKQKPDDFDLPVAMGQMALGPAGPVIYLASAGDSLPGIQQAIQIYFDQNGVRKGKGQDPIQIIEFCDANPEKNPWHDQEIFKIVKGAVIRMGYNVARAKAYKLFEATDEHEMDDILNHMHSKGTICIVVGGNTFRLASAFGDLPGLSKTIASRVKAGQLMYVSFSAGSVMAGLSVEIARDDKDEVSNAQRPRAPVPRLRSPLSIPRCSSHCRCSMRAETSSAMALGSCRMQCVRIINLQAQRKLGKSLKTRKKLGESKMTLAGSSSLLAMAPCSIWRTARRGSLPTTTSGSSGSFHRVSSAFPPHSRPTRDPRQARAASSRRTHCAQAATDLGSKSAAVLGREFGSGRRSEGHTGLQALLTRGRPRASCVSDSE